MSVGGTEYIKVRWSSLAPIQLEEDVFLPHAPATGTTPKLYSHVMHR